MNVSFERLAWKSQMVEGKTCTSKYNNGLFYVLCSLVHTIKFAIAEVRYGSLVQDSLTSSNYFSYLFVLMRAALTCPFISAHLWRNWIGRRSFGSNKTGPHLLTRIHLHTPPTPTCSRWYDHEWLKADYKSEWFTPPPPSHCPNCTQVGVRQVCVCVCGVGWGV